MALFGNNGQSLGDLMLLTEKKDGKALKTRRPFARTLAEAYEKKWVGCPCCFVLSTGRVGTKTLSALFALSSEVQSYHEPLPRLIKASYDVYMGENTSPETALELIYAARDDRICQALFKGQIYTETNNRLTYFAHLLAQAFPASKFIHLYRHPYDVIRSGMRRKYYVGHKWDFARIRPRKGSLLVKEWQRYSPLKKTAWYWAEVNRFSIDFLKTLPEERKLFIKAEKLFAGDSQTIRTLYNFLGVPVPDSKQVEKVLGQKLNEQPKGGGQIAVDWSNKNIEEINQQVRNIANHLDYILK